MLFSNKQQLLKERGKMKKLIKTSISLCAVFALMITFSLQQVSAADKIRWKVQSTFNTGWPALGDPVARLSDTLKRATDGRIQLKVYEPGKILPPLEISPSITKGDLPAAYNYMAYDQGRILQQFYLQLFHLVWSLGNMQLGGLKEKALN